jgi:two-component sensor histidine kinase
MPGLNRDDSFLKLLVMSFFKPFSSLVLFFFFCAVAVAQRSSSNASDTTVKRLTAEIGQLAEGEPRTAKYYDLSKYYIDKPGEAKEDITAAQNYCTLGLKFSLQHNFINEIARGYTIQAQILREKGDQPGARKFSDKVFSLTDKITEPAVLADIYFERSGYYSLGVDSQLVLKTKFYRLGTTYLKQAAPNTLKLADALKFLGDLYSNMPGGNAPALSYLYESLAIYKAHKYERLQDIYDLIGYCLARMERSREGLNYSLMAVRLGEKDKDSSMTMCAIYNRLGYAYNNLGDHQKETECMLKSIMYAKHNHQEMSYDILTANLAVAYINLKAYEKALNIVRPALRSVPKDNYVVRLLLTISLVRIYTAMQDYRSADALFGKLTPLTALAQQRPIMYDLMYSAGINLYMKRQEYGKVDSLIKVYRMRNSSDNNLQSAAKAEEFTYKADSAQQRYKEAFFHHQAFKKLSDSLTTRNHDKETEVIQLQFETEKKDHDIESQATDIKLLTKQSLLQKSALRNEAMVRNLSLLAVCMLISLSAVIYNRYKIKRKANDELEEQKEEINTQNEALKELITEREWLLKEVHHRVKNNLQIVISLLNSQSAYIDNASAREVIRESKNRINSISMIHQKLYQTEDLAGVDIYQYIHELVEYIAATFGVADKVAFSLEIDKLTLDVAQAVPLGLIINEGLTNAVKYAVLPDREPKIGIRLIKTEDNIFLRITDNGDGLPAGFEPEKLKSLGMVLMRGLSKQLGGHLIFNNKGGLELTMEFKMNKLLGGPLDQKMRKRARLS